MPTQAPGWLIRQSTPVALRPILLLRGWSPGAVGVEDARAGTCPWALLPGRKLCGRRQQSLGARPYGRGFVCEPRRPPDSFFFSLPRKVFQQAAHRASRLVVTPRVRQIAPAPCAGGPPAACTAARQGLLCAEYALRSILTFAQPVHATSHTGLAPERASRNGRYSSCLRRCHISLWLWLRFWL